MSGWMSSRRIDRSFSRSRRRPGFLLHSVFTTVAVPVVFGLGTPLAAQVPAADVQIRAALSAAPEDLRDGARVIGRDAQGRLTDLRAGRNEIVCLADDPDAEGFSVACYHESLDPFMSRGRALRAEGHPQGVVDSIRAAEVESGRLPMPEAPATLYVRSGPEGSFDPATGSLEGASLRWVVYVPYATSESTGLSTRPARGAPWLMFPGTYRAHIMITPGGP